LPAFLVAPTEIGQSSQSELIEKKTIGKNLDFRGNNFMKLVSDVRDEKNYGDNTRAKGIFS
jgi:hypothetical protein